MSSKDFTIRFHDFPENSWKKIISQVTKNYIVNTVHV